MNEQQLPADAANTQPQHTAADAKTLKDDIHQLIARLEAMFGRSRPLAVVATKLDEAEMWTDKEIASLPNDVKTEVNQAATDVANETAPTATADTIPEQPSAPIQK